MLLEVRAVAPFFKNGFVLGCETTREGIVIDPGDEVPDLLSIVEREQLSITYILLTHAHVDHVTGVAKAKAALDAPICLHRDDLFLYREAVQHGVLFGLEVDEPPPVDHFYDGPGPWRFGDYEAIVHHTPGHCPGGVCLQVGEAGKAGQTGTGRARAGQDKREKRGKYADYEFTDGVGHFDGLQREFDGAARIAARSSRRVSPG